MRTGRPPPRRIHRREGRILLCHVHEMPAMCPWSFLLFRIWIGVSRLGINVFGRRNGKALGQGLLARCAFGAVFGRGHGILWIYVSIWY